MGTPSAAYKQQEQEAWHFARRIDTAQSYAHYLSSWSKGPHAEEAQRRINRLREESLWAWAQSQDQIPAYEQYLQTHPEGNHAVQAYQRINGLEVEQAWAHACQLNTVSAFLTFRRDYDDSPHAEEAAERVVSLIKQKSQVPTTEAHPEEEAALEAATQEDTAQAYQAFLDTYPESHHRPAVMQRLRQLEDKLQGSIEALGREVELWDQATRLHTRYAYQNYLHEFPHGRFATLAKNRLLALDQQWRWKHRVWVAQHEPAALAVNAPEDPQLDQEIVRNDAAQMLAWIWLAGFLLLGGLCAWLLPFLLPMTIVIGLATGAHFVLNRGQQITTAEILPYLIGGTASIGVLVGGLGLQITTSWTESLLSGATGMVIAGALLGRYFYQLRNKAS